MLICDSTHSSASMRSRSMRAGIIETFSGVEGVITMPESDMVSSCKPDAHLVRLGKVMIGAQSQGPTTPRHTIQTEKARSVMGELANPRAW